MNYTVVWVGTAERQLAEIWVSTSNRAGVTETARMIERELASHPQWIGESRDLGQRILLMPTLGVRYEVSPSDRLVRVLRVWEITRRVR
jgi:plasmid stabilization system protein ParE